MFDNLARTFSNYFRGGKRSEDDYFEDDYAYSEEDEYDDSESEYYDEKPAKKSPGLISKFALRKKDSYVDEEREDTPYDIEVVAPENMEDSRHVADILKAGHSVVLNTQKCTVTLAASPFYMLFS